MTQAAWQPVIRRLARVATVIDDTLRRHRLRRQAAKQVPVSKRSPVGNGKDLLVVALQQCGLTFHGARQAVNDIAKMWEENVVEHRPVETPFGWLTTGTKVWIRRRFGKQCRPPLDNYIIVLKEKKKGLFSTPLETVESGNKTHDTTPLHGTPQCLTCPDCGGTYFTEVACQQYQCGRYSSSVGGQLKPLSDDDSIHTLVCLCTLPLNVNSRAHQEPRLASFRASLEKAQAYRRRESFEERLQKAAGDLVDAELLKHYTDEAWRIEELADFAMGKPTKAPKPAASKTALPTDRKFDKIAQPTILSTTLTNVELALELSSRLNIPQIEAERIVEVTFETLRRAVDTAGRMEIRGFGTFSARLRRAWKGRHAQNRKIFECGSKKIAHFKPSKRLTGLVNKGLTH